MTPDRTKAASEILSFYLEAGVDTSMGETPVDRLAGDLADANALIPPTEGGRVASEASRVGATAPRAPLTPSVPLFGTSPAIAAPPPPDEAAMAAREAAKSAPDLET